MIYHNIINAITNFTTNILDSRSKPTNFVSSPTDVLDWILPMKLPRLFKKKETTTLAATSAVPWQYWPSCNHPKTLSFRAGSGSDNMFKTVNSVFFDPITEGGADQSWFINSSSSSDNQSTTECDHEDGEESLDTVVVRGARSERLFFKPEDTSSMVQKAKGAGGGEMMNPLLKEKYVVVLASMESEDPLKDFRRSMEEMVECHGLSKDWEGLEELLGWYLKVNQKNNHGFIVAAFVDLLLALSAAAAAPSHHNYYYSTSFSSAISSFSRSSPLSSSFQGQEEDDIAEQVEITMS
ncbi:transcription repressor OFP13-like [Malus sylvestris]|uniref:transcription repressor OFP13-like n=1 Tax=Malus sylvestris TaxID=3752 RepID=UPI0021ABC7F9|nr:transcription repressor OFP13-like [Malus sylvestris]